MRARYVYVRGQGTEALQRVAQALPETDRETFDAGYLETRWYPYELFETLNATIDRVLGNGDGEIGYAMGRFSCDANLTTVMRLFFKFGNVGWLLDRAAKAWRTQFDEGTMEVVERDVGNRVAVELRDHSHPNRLHCLAIKGWMVRATELSGEDQLECEEQCRALGDDVCRWTFVWPK